MEVRWDSRATVTDRGKDYQMAHWPSNMSLDASCSEFRAFFPMRCPLRIFLGNRQPPHAKCTGGSPGSRSRVLQGGSVQMQVPETGLAITSATRFSKGLLVGLVLGIWSAGVVSVRLNSKDPEGAKPRAEAVAAIVSDIRERRS